MSAGQQESFYTCSMCGHAWSDREDFLADPNLEMIGYQVNFKKLSAGALCFNHSCHTTLGIWAEAFSDLYQGPIFETRKTGTDECPGHCIHTDELDPCRAQCECAYVREIMRIIREWPKAPVEK